LIGVWLFPDFCNFFSRVSLCLPMANMARLDMVRAELMKRNIIAVCNLYSFLNCRLLKSQKVNRIAG